jgi:hypothetical protein
MDGTGDYHVNRSKPVPQRHASYASFHMWNFGEKNDSDMKRRI